MTNRNMRRAIAAGTALLMTVGLSGQALAQDSWTGFYVGGQLGYGFQPSDNDETILFDTNLDGSFGDTVNTAAGANAFSPGFCGGTALGATPGAGCGEDRDGTIAGAHAGYDVEIGSGLVVGVVGSYDRTQLSDSVSSFSTTPARYTMTRRLRDVFTLRARAGVASGNTLLYATGGGAYGNVRNSFSTSNAVNSFTGNGNERGWGYVLGGGAEQRFAGGLSIGALYLYRSIDAGDYVVRAGPGTAGATNPFRIVNPSGTDFARSSDRFSSHSVQVTASFRF